MRQPWEFDVRVVGGKVVFPVAEQSVSGFGIRGYRLSYSARTPIWVEGDGESKR